MADPREDLVDPILGNEPGLLPPREPLRIRVSPYDTPPPSDTGWGGFGSGGRPTGRLFEPDMEPAVPEQPPWQGGRLLEPDQTPAPQKPTFQPGLLSLGNIPRVIGGLVQGARDSFNAPQPASAASAPPPARDPTAGPRAMWQQGYPSAEYSSMFGGPAKAAVEASGVPAFIKSGEGYFDPETYPGQRQQQARQQVETGANVTANFAGTGIAGAGIREGASAGVFGGRLAKGFDPNKEKLAATMEANGVPAPQIWKETGMVKFADGKWAHEISDLGAYYKGDVDSIASRIFDQKYPDRAGTYGQGVMRGNMARSDIAKNEALLKMQGKAQLYLPDVLHHPELFAKYPELLKMPVSQDAMMHAQGAYFPHSVAGTDVRPASIVYREQTQPGKMARGATFDTLLHEIQHAIAQIEGFAKGSNTHQMQSLLPGTGANKIFTEEMKRFAKPMSEEDFLTMNKFAKTKDNDTYAKYMEDYRKRLSAHEDFLQTFAAEQAYPRSAGEGVAELPPLRKDLTPEQAAAIPPPSQFRVPMDQQFVEYNRLVNPQGTTPQQMGGVLGLGHEGPQMSADPGRLQRPSGLATDRQTAGYSNIKGGTSVENMNWRVRHGPPTETRTSMPVDKALRPGDEIIPIVGDDTRKLNQGYVTEIGGQPVTPVLQQGGFDFGLGQPVDPRTGLRDVWGNAQGAATQIDNMARAAEARGNRPVIVSTTMKKTGGDFSPQLYDPTIELLKRNPPDERLAAILDTFMRTKNNAGAAYTPEQFPGFASPEVWKVLENAPGTMRAKIMKALDRKAVVDAGGPDVGLIRVSQSNPDLYNTPSGYMGYHIADVAPGQTGRAAHSAFPIATRGSNVRGLGGSVPGELMLPELAKGLEEMHRRTGRPEYLNQMDYYAIRVPNEAAVNLGMKPLPRTQVVTKQMIDAIGEWVNKHGLKSLPPAVATLYLANSGGEAKAAPMGGVVDPSGYNAQ